ncbi:two component transcriptional regulator, LytTR family [Hymenobacter daecheongensis DSM 21074]|uniref:Two component transcriptional regulator, LytTR family n=1 Tax=Hymenobacter daecheongensis DSM 21074 TaxID=1121955 RepID=A0A1M6A8M1_9BACT|nr:LytTR family DNA-binding domain-containing protein [Hymenobacter daecheongensis]SHI32818.1 two component transcriptional regulator, LytTR family [Hymenobacter daecheongensis DSM 21074]
MQTLTCLAVDDEPLALSHLCGYIERTPFLRLAGRYTNALEALHALQAQPVDLLFLDIHMPELTGLELARLLETAGGPTPRLVFTTAFQQYALDGYRLDALDYLLKPFGYDEFLRVALKAQRQAVPPSAPASEPAADSVILKVESQLVKVRFADVCYIEGLRDYARVHRRDPLKPLMTLSSLRALEEKLPAGQFMRLHRSFIVNLSCIEAVSRLAVQIGETHIPIGVQYKDEFGEFLKTWLE